MFPFGFGLSYTTFTYGSLTLSAPKIRVGEKMTARFNVANSGTREGTETAQLYIGQLHPGEPRPLKELKGFARIQLRPGETRQVELSFDKAALSFYSARKKAWIAEPGEFQVMIGGSSRDIKLTGTFTVVE